MSGGIRVSLGGTPTLKRCTAAEACVADLPAQPPPNAWRRRACVPTRPPSTSPPASWRGPSRNLGPRQSWPSPRVMAGATSTTSTASKVSLGKSGRPVGAREAAGSDCRSCGRADPFTPPTCACTTCRKGDKLPPAGHRAAASAGKGAAVVCPCVRLEGLMRSGAWLAGGPCCALRVPHPT